MVNRFGSRHDREIEFDRVREKVKMIAGVAAKANDAVPVSHAGCEMREWFVHGKPSHPDPPSEGDGDSESVVYGVPVMIRSIAL